MTSGERADLQLLADFIHEWRREDTQWKGETDKRLRAVEGFVTGALAERRASTRASMSRKQKIGVIFAGIGILSSTVLGIANFVTAH